MGGGTCASAPPGAHGDGLSPRGRGNRWRCGPAGSRPRSIPAWAGEPHMGKPEAEVRKVYPRVGGGTHPPPWDILERTGLSPRGRGNQFVQRRTIPFQGSIPAWAGEPSRNRAESAPFPVYPRVGGGTVGCRLLQVNPGGLSPRGRGNPATDTGRPPARRVYPRVGGGTFYPR